MAEDEQNPKTIPLEVIRLEDADDMTMELSLSDIKDLRVQDTRMDDETPEDTSPLQPASEPREVSTLQLTTVPISSRDYEEHTHVIDAAEMMRQARLLSQADDDDDDSRTLNDMALPPSILALRDSMDGSTQNFEIPAALIALAQAGNLDETSMQLPHITSAMLRQVEEDALTDLEESTTPDEEEPETQIVEFAAEVDAQGCIRIPFALLESRIIHPGTLLRIRAKIIKETP